MFTLKDYEIIEEIYNSPKRVVYRGIRLLDEQPVIFKCFGTAYPTPREIARLKYEYEITKNLNLPGIIKPLVLLTDLHNPILILEDMGGYSLKKYLNQYPLQLDKFFTISIQIAQILGELHQSGIVHKDIKPSNLILNPNTLEVKLTDFAIASQLTRENPSISHPNLLEGSLAYMSPEQTGRMNRAIDYRTDLYSLGVSFYEMLTGQLPCYSNDSMELVHCHIARIPVPPNQINPQIPQVVSDLIMKLLAKTAEDRYQSGFGLKFDLENCLNQCQETGKIREFPLATLDFSGQLQIPQKLYGRERELSQLLCAFERVRVGKTEMILVTGYSGIGKSALVQEIQKPLVRHRGYFITGKFDQFQRNIPYSALIQAFSDLIHQLLTESPQQIQIWQKKLLAALGTNSQIIIDVIPEVELIIGKQPPVSQIGAVESQNRFNLVFQKFIDVFTRKEHPLVLFLDDLQWADFASLKLIQLLMTELESRYLLLIGAYRDNEVYQTHPLAIALDSISANGAIINKIKLLPLQLEHTIRLMAETLQTDSCSVEPLAALVERKTEGNPFFVNQFLKTLYQEDLLVFKRPQSFTCEANEKSGWCWDIDKIEAMGITENVVELMIGKLKKFPEFTQYLLQLAACVGNSFDLQTLAIISETSPIQAFQNLLPALKEGLILPTSDLEISDRESANSQFVILTYTFLHDRVQQSAYTLIDPQLQQEVHLRIGRLLLANISPEQQAERIFELVDHLNLGWSLIDRESEKLELARLNILAARKAKDSLAYKAARDYLFSTLSHFTTELWKTQYKLALNLHQNLAEIEYLNGNFEASEALIAIILQNSNSALEKAEVYNMLIVQYTLLMKYEAAIQAGLKALKLLGFELPETEWLDAVQIELSEASVTLANRQIVELINEEKMRDPVQKMAMKLLGNMGPLTFFSHQDIWQWTVIKAINLSLKYGFVAGGSYCYSCYGIILSIKLGDYQSGYEFGKLSLALSQNFQNWTQNCQDNVIFSNYLNCWINHIKTTHSLNEEALKIGIESGNLQWSGYNRMFQALTLFYQGINLERVQQEYENFLCFCYQTKNQWASDIILANQIAIFQMIGKLNETNEIDYFKSFHKHQSWAGLCEYHVVKAQVLYLFQQYDEALKHILLAGEKIDFIMGHISSSHYNFYYSLILTSLYPSASESMQQEYWQTLLINQEQMKIWADLCPENFLHKYLLVAAEMARISGKTLEAMDLYDRAITSAKEENFIQNEALGNELAAYFWKAKGKEKFAELYLKEAYFNYQNWGALEKVKLLEKANPQLTLNSRNKNDLAAEDTLGITISKADSNTNSSNPGIILDLATVMKASQAIASEIDLNNLLIKLMQIVLENAGAQSGILLLNREGQLFIEATGTIETDQRLFRQSIPVEGSDRIPLSIINYVARTQEDVILTDASKQGNFINDPYIINNQIKSVLCTPILGQGKLIGILYLENNLITAAFTFKQTQLLKLLCSQAAISLENARLYEGQKDYAETLEHKVQELQKTETELRQSEERYRSLVIATSKMAWIWMTDAQGQAYDIPVLREYTGQTIEQVSNWGWLEALHPDDRDLSTQVWMQAVATKSLYETEYRLRAADGSYRYFSARGVPILAEDGSIREWVGICADIHDRKQAEIDLQKANEELEFRVQERTAELQKALEQVQQEIVERQQTEAALQESQRALSTLIKNLPGIAYRNLYDKNWTMEFVSEGCFELTGYYPEDLIGNRTLSYEEMTHPEDRISVRQKIETAIALHQPFEIVYRIITAEGKPKWVWEKGQGIFSLAGKPLALEGFITDISDRKEAEAALQKALASADAASRAKGEFLSKMSHELRTPLNAVLGFTQILNRDGSLTAQQQEYLGIINRASEHLLTLINDVLEMSKIEAGRIELHEQIFDLYNLLNSLEEMFQLKAASKDLQLIFNISQDVPQYIKTDESKLRQVLINLIGNAIKFTKTGNVTLRITSDTANKLDSSNSLLFFEIEDTGPGISSEEIDSLFEAFVQTAAGKQSQSGTGLGLPISRQFVQLMGGEITVSSILNQGSIFKFNIQISLPKVIEIPKSTVTQRAIALEPNQPNYRILVVEDQPENRLLLVNLLSQVGFEVRQAVNGQEAVTLTEIWQPHLIWMDIQMPIMNGYEATKRIRSLQTLHPIVIALTANAFAEDKAHILATGCDDFVSKPFQEAVIFEKMAQYLGVNYIYEKMLPKKEEKPKIKGIFPILNNSESFSGMSMELYAQLHQATKALDEERLRELIEQIRSSHPLLYKNLAGLLKQLRFDKMVEILEQFKND